MKEKNIMKEEKRNVELTLEKAKEWYKKGGELKEVALQAFKEEELNNSTPRSWKEYCNNYTGKAYFIENSTICGGQKVYGGLCAENDKNTLPSKELAEAFLAMMQLMSLRQAWIGDWEPNLDGENFYNCIVLLGNKYIVEDFSKYRQTLSFPTEEMAEDFMNCFRDLLEKANGLY